MDKKHHSVIGREKLNNKTELTVEAWFGVKPFSGFRGLAHIERDKHGLPLLRRPLRWSCHHLYINGFYRDDSKKLGSTQTEE